MKEEGKVKMSKSVWKIVLFVALLALMAGLCATASADTCAPGTHQWYYDTVPDIAANRPCGSTFNVTDHCVVCGETWERTIIIQDHKAGTPVETLISPDCLNGGWRYTTTYCIRCGEKMSETKVELSPLGHDWGDWVTTVQPTCVGKGEQIRICKRDSSHQEKKDLAPIGHNWDSGKVTKLPDCTNEGVMTFTCQNDPSHVKTEPIPVIPDAHVWDNGKVTKQPTCATPGVKTYTCTINPDHTRTVEIPIDPNAHNYDNGKVTVPPDCEKEGKKVYTCQNDPSHIKEEILPPTGHKWDEGTIIKPATITETGIKQYVCQNNSAHTKEEIIPKIMFGNNTLCAFGPRLRDVDLYPYNTDLWYMFTPFDASKDGRQTFELVASNNYIVGTLTMTIRDGKLTVDYTLNSNTIDVTLEFFTILNQISDIHVYEPEKLLNLNMKVREPIDLQEKFGDDRNLVLYFCSRIDYTYSDRFQPLNYDSIAHQRLLNEMLKMMDR